MRTSGKIFLLILIVGIAVSGGWFAYSWFASNSVEDSFSPQSASSTVDIENGVSGVVTLTDPTLNQSVDVNVDFFPLNSGSGAIVTKDGYIITAFHVVGDPKTLETKKELKKMDDADINYYLEQGAVLYYLSNSNPKLGAELSAQVGKNLTSLTNLFRQKNLLNVKSYKQVIKVNFPSSVQINDNNSLIAQLIDTGDPNGDKDVAILKVDAPNQNLPTINIRDEGPRIGEKIRIYGYPYNNTKTELENQSLTPSSTSGLILAPIRHSMGTVYYQTTALTAHGYSGGPVVDNQNNLVGIVVFGVKFNNLMDKYITGNYTSFLSSEYIKEICNKNNVPLNVV